MPETRGGVRARTRSPVNNTSLGNLTMSMEVHAVVG
jgi:hypothetical protein